VSLEEVTSTRAFPFVCLRVTKVKPSPCVELARLGSKYLGPEAKDDYSTTLVILSAAGGLGIWLSYATCLGN
jgi:hypothetical protein